MLDFLFRLKQKSFIFLMCKLTRKMALHYSFVKKHNKKGILNTESLSKQSFVHTNCIPLPLFGIPLR